MSKLLAQHGAAKGKKINDSLNFGSLSGAIFSINDETFNSINTYVQSSDLLDKNNSYLDPQFYYSTFDVALQKKLNEVSIFPTDITRRDWRNREAKVLDYIEYHAKSSKLISNQLITPGFYIDNIDWHFDYSVEIYNYCMEKYKFDNYALSLLVQSSFFNNKKNVQEMIEELDDLCDKRDYIYLTICYDNNTDNNYEDIDSNCLGNILSFIYQSQQKGFKFLIGYGFMNSVLFAMLGCEYVASGWFNTLRKFQKSKFETVNSFGRRKKRYTSIPLLSYIMFDDINIMVDSDQITKKEIISGTDYDDSFLYGEDLLSFVDLEHQYWQSLKNVFDELESISNLAERVSYIQDSISKAQEIYKKVCKKLDERNEQESLKRIKSASKHLLSWKVAIDLFRQNEMIL